MRRCHRSHRALSACCTDMNCPRVSVHYLMFTLDQFSCLFILHRSFELPQNLVVCAFQFLNEKHSVRGVEPAAAPFALSCVGLEVRSLLDRTLHCTEPIPIGNLAILSFHGLTSNFQRDLRSLMRVLSWLTMQMRRISYSNQNAFAIIFSRSERRYLYGDQMQIWSFDYSAR